MYLDEKSKFGRLFTDVLHHNVYIDSAEAFSHGYAETGLFGVKLSGSSAHVRNVFENAIGALRGLREIKKNEFESAKSTLNRFIHEYWQFPKYRLEYFARNLSNHEKAIKNYQEAINSITFDDV